MDGLLHVDRTNVYFTTMKAEGKGWDFFNLACPPTPTPHKYT